MGKRFLKIMVPLLIFPGFSMPPHGFSFVEEEGQKTYIVDRTGERWDVTQAVSLGFKPGGFQYGIGRDAFDTLDHRHMSDDHQGVSPGLRVIGMVREGEAQAYSVRRLSYHEVANTRVGAEAIAVAYWPLVDLAAVYSRRIQDRTLTLAPSGWTYNNTFVLYDKETGSLWYPVEGGLKAVQGPYFGEVLPEVSSEDTRWRRWVGRYPHSKILK